MTAGSIDTKHPEYQCHYPDWLQCRDTSSGQRAVKERDNGMCYLPPTQGMWIDGGGQGAEMFKTMQPYSKGWRAYQTYLGRALFIPFIRDSADMILGMIWNKPPQVQLPKNGKMDWVLQKVSPKGESLLQLMRNLCYEQIIMGRAGLLTDFAKPATEEQALQPVLPYIAMYGAESIINWDSGDHNAPGEALNLIVLDETSPKRTGFDWSRKKKYRVLQLGDFELNERTGAYRAGQFEQDDEGISFDPKLMAEPNIRGRKLLYLPFSFVGSIGNTSDIDDPPLLGLSDMSLSIYRLQADYRQSMFMNGQDTLFTSGWTRREGEALRIGAGGHIHADSPDAEAKFIGTSSMGLPELRQALENDIKLAASKAGELMDASSRARESGTALEMRIGTKTATLNSIAMANAKGMERQLKYMAEWLGYNPDEIKITPNEEFASKEFASQDFYSIVQSKLLGAPISYRSVHEWAVGRGYTKLSFEEMMAQIEEEGSMMDGLMSAAKSNADAIAPPPPPAAAGGVKKK